MKIFTPNETVSSQTRSLILAAWVLSPVIAWAVFRSAIFPSPLDVLGAVPDLWFQDGLGQELLTSTILALEALALSTLIGLPVAYLSLTPAFKPMAEWISGLRFLSPAVFFLPLLFVLSSGHAVKVWMLTIGETFFLVEAMLGVVDGVTLDALDDARTLKMSEWLVLWYVVVRGTLDQAIGAIQENAAMGFSMLIFVEGIVRSEGGVGVLILNSEKHFNLSSMYAIATALTLVGLGLDYVLSVLRITICPWTVRA